MATMASTIANIRRILADSPDEDTTTAVISTAGQTTVTVSTINKFAQGNVWEFRDGTTGAEQVLITSIDTGTSTITMRRGHRDSTATTHSSGVVMLKDPRWAYDLVAQMVTEVTDGELYQEGIYAPTTHTLVASATTNVFNAPSTSCERFVRVYYRLNANDDPIDIWRFKFYPQVDSALYANGRYAIIRDQPLAGTTLYVTCAHKVAITTATASQERIIDYLAAAKLMEGAEIRRHQGPTTQADQTVQPNSGLRTAAYYRSVAEELMAKEQSYLDRYVQARWDYIRR